jgi:hypothetical protein
MCYFACNLDSNAALTQGRISLRIWKFEIRAKFAKFPKKMRPYKWLQMLANCLRMSLRIRQMLPNVLTSVCECLTNETTTQLKHAELHIHLMPLLNCFTLSLIRQTPPCESCECLRMTLRILWMLANALANLANACDCLRKCCENNENMIFVRNFGTCS